jgi:hypothetical protein
MRVRRGDEHPGGDVEERARWCGDGVEQPGDGAGCDVAAGLDGGEPELTVTVRSIAWMTRDDAPQTATEVVTKLLASARRTMLLRHMLEAIGLALAGRAGARMASRLG